MNFSNFLQIDVNIVFNLQQSSIMLSFTVMYIANVTYMNMLMKQNKRRHKFLAKYIGAHL